MIGGAQVMIFTRDEDADRAFLRDVVGLPCIDSGGGWGHPQAGGASSCNGPGGSGGKSAHCN